jgi:hypothetical protein
VSEGCQQQQHQASESPPLLLLLVPVLLLVMMPSRSLLWFHAQQAPRLQLLGCRLQCPGCQLTHLLLSHHLLQLLHRHLLWQLSCQLQQLLRCHLLCRLGRHLLQQQPLPANPAAPVFCDRVLALLLCCQLQQAGHQPRLHVGASPQCCCALQEAVPLHPLPGLLLLVVVVLLLPLAHQQRQQQ